jgi:hypothetical protein
MTGDRGMRESSGGSITGGTLGSDNGAGLPSGKFGPLIFWNHFAITDLLSLILLSNENTLRMDRLQRHGMMLAQPA